MRNRKRNRMKGYDYSRDNLYFVTACVKNRVCCFGSARVGSARVGSARVGSARVGSARELTTHNFQDFESRNLPESNQGLDNHFLKLNAFGLIVEERIKWLAEQYPYVEIHNFVVMPNHIHLIIEIDSLKVENLEIKIKSLSGLIGALKTTSSKLIHEAGNLDFAWQRSFHDHIIRSDKAYQNINRYIDKNPEKWIGDTFFSNS